MIQLFFQKLSRIGIFLCCLLLSGLPLSGQSRSGALNVFLQSESVKHASVSLEMVDLTTGKTVVSHNPDMSLTPASTMKIVTTATALDILGSQFSYTTPLLYDGTIENSVLKGNLYIEGSGDPTLGSEFTGQEKENFLAIWLAAIRKAGIGQVDGKLIVLDQLYGYEGISPKWVWEDLGNYYAPGIYGVSIFDNMYRLYVCSTAAGTTPTILYAEPAMDNLQWTNTMTASSSNADDSYISGVPFSNRRLLYGHIPANRSSFPVKGDIPDPGLFLANCFKDYLHKNGIEISGEATTFRLTAQLPRTRQELTSVQSPALTAIARVTNVNSNNHYAEQLYKRLTVKEQIDIPAYWQAKGLDASALFMYDGSGTSPFDALSAGFLVQLLEYMDKNGKDLYTTFPVAGKEGTVASFLKGTALEGKARLKSGSITNVQAYAGYIEKGDKRYAVALIVNRFSEQRAVLKKEMEKLLVGCTE